MAIDAPAKESLTTVVPQTWSAIPAAGDCRQVREMTWGPEKRQEYEVRQKILWPHRVA